MDYRGEGFTPVNGANRGLKRMTKRYRRQTEAMDRALYGAPRSGRELIVYRNFGYPELVNLWESGRLQRGYVFEEAAFSSASLDVGVAQKYNEDSRGGLIGRITLPRGTPGSYLDVVHDMGEREMLLPRGAAFSYRGWTSFGGLRIARFELVYVPEDPVAIPYVPYAPQKRARRRYDK